MPNTFRILTVCTGNICRSPLAMQLLRESFKGYETFEVSSAGVQALVGHQMPSDSQRIARLNGISAPELHTAQQLSTELVEQADLILAMDRSHRKAIVELSPRSSKKVFTLIDLARLIDATSDEDLYLEVNNSVDLPRPRLLAALEAARLSRSELLPLSDPITEDVIDPYQQPADVFDQSAAQLIPAIQTIAQYFIKALKTT